MAKLNAVRTELSQDKKTLRLIIRAEGPCQFPTEESIGLSFKGAFGKNCLGIPDEFRGAKDLGLGTLIVEFAPSTDFKDAEKVNRFICLIRDATKDVKPKEAPIAH
jgi:hypothetical protein